MRTTVAASILVALCTATVAASADDREGAGSAGALVGFSGDYGTGLALGARGGYTFSTPVYVGATAVYHLGTCPDFEPGVPCIHTGNIFYAGAELGYDIHVRLLTLRPYLGVGDVVGLSAYREHAFGVWPGVAALIGFKQFFVGPDLRFVLVGGHPPRDYDPGEQAFGYILPYLVGATSIFLNAGVTF